MASAVIICKAISGESDLKRSFLGMQQCRIYAKNIFLTKSVIILMFLENLSSSMLEICGKYHLSYESASERCDISSRFFGDIVRRRSAPSLGTFEKICMGFEKTPNELLGVSSGRDALLFRIPMRVFTLHSTDGRVYPICPNCGCPIGRESQRFCGSCGQALSWEGFAPFGGELQK